MDVGSDFITPEMLNILFFEQRNLVVFPYVDQKHLQALEIFTIGYTPIQLDSTALHNVKELIEYQYEDSYSQNPSFYFILNIPGEGVKDFLEMKSLHCIINTKDSVKHLANGEEFIFYNKKLQKFVNFSPESVDLTLEKELISSSKSNFILQDKIQSIKMTASKLYSEIMQDSDINTLKDMLREYNPKFWNKILKYTGLYFKINVPELDYSINPKEEDLKNITRKPIPKSSAAEEYHLVTNSNKAIAKEFIRQLHQYRADHVNSSNLELDQLWDPQLLYEYLREHHWNKGFPEDFTSRWVRMESTRHRLSNDDIEDFTALFHKLDISDDLILDSLESVLSSEENDSRGPKATSKNPSKIPSKLKPPKDIVPPITGFDEFEKWFLYKIEKIERLLQINHSRSYKNSEQDSYSSRKGSNGSFPYIIDGANVILAKRDSSGKGMLSNIILLLSELENLGIKNVQVVCDASLRHDIDHKERYENFIRQNIITQAPAGTEADLFILQWARKRNALIITNDQYKDHYARFGEGWIKSKRITFSIIDDDIFFEPEITII